MKFGYTHFQLSILETIDISANIISIITSLIITIIYLKNKELQTFVFKLIIILCNLNQIFSCSKVFFQFIPKQGYKYTPWCSIQGAMVNLGALSTAGMTVVISVCAYLSINKQMPIQDLQNKYYKKFILGAVLFALATTLTGFIDEDFGPTGASCWINHINKSVLEVLIRRFLIFYTWLWLSVLVNIVLFALIYHKIKEYLSEIKEENNVSMQVEQNVKKFKRSLQIYPLTIALCWFFDTLLVILIEYIEREHKLFFILSIFQQLFLGLQGFFISLIFCKNQQVRSILKQRWAKKVEKVRSLSSTSDLSSSMNPLQRQLNPSISSQDSYQNDRDSYNSQISNNRDSSLSQSDQNNRENCLNSNNTSINGNDSQLSERSSQGQQQQMEMETRKINFNVAYTKDQLHKQKQEQSQHSQKGKKKIRKKVESEESLEQKIINIDF